MRLGQFVRTRPAIAILKEKWTVPACEQMYKNLVTVLESECTRDPDLQDGYVKNVNNFVFVKKPLMNPQ